MKLHFASLDDFQSRQLVAALAADHEVSSGPDSIDASYDGLVIGVESRVDDELIKSAKDIGVHIYSIPELLYHLCADKQRIVIAGTHGKAAVASFVIHVLNMVNKEVDFFVGKPLLGHENAAKISDAPVIIIDGSANHCSDLDKSPQFLRLSHHIALITPLSHEYKDLYPSFDEYVKQFDQLADVTPKGGTVVYCEEDHLVTVIGGKEREDVRSFSYTSHAGKIENDVTSIDGPNGKIGFKTSNDHDLQNIGGALALLKRLSVTEEQFYKAIESYRG